jgi:hypothetical protein
MSKLTPRSAPKVVLTDVVVCCATDRLNGLVPLSVKAVWLADLIARGQATASRFETFEAHS